MLRAPAPPRLLGLGVRVGLSHGSRSCRETAKAAWPLCPTSLHGTLGGIDPQSGAAQEGAEPSSTRPIAIPRRAAVGPGRAFLLPPAVFAKLLQGKRWEPPAPPAQPPEPRHDEPGDSGCLSLQEERGSQRSLPGPTAARPSRRRPACPRASGRPPCPRCTRRATATAGLPSPTASGRTGRRPQVGLEGPRAAVPASQGVGRPRGAGARPGRGWLTLVCFLLPAGSTPFPYNPLTMRLPSGVVAAAPSAPLPQGTPGSQHHAWDEEPKPLLCSQYETLSDSE